MKKFNNLPIVFFFALFAILIFSKSNAWGQILAWDFNGNVGSEVTVNATTNNSNLNTSVISRGSGLTNPTNADRFNSENWTTNATIDANDYLEFSISPKAEYNYSISSIYMQHQRSGTGPVNFVVRSSLDSYTTDLGGVQIVPDESTTKTSTFTFNHVNISSTVTYRIYAYSAESSSGSWGPGDGANYDLAIEGTVNYACLPPTLALQIPSTSSITTTAANLNGSITNVGGGTLCTTRGFQYSTNSDLSSPTDLSEGGGSGSYPAENYSLSATSLTANTKYYFRAYAINDCGIAQTGYSHTSGYESFTTLPAAPTAQTSTNVTSNAFTANWSAPTQGSESFTYTIEIDNNSDFSSIEITQSGIVSTTTLFNTTINLLPSTDYYYRIKCVNATGSGEWSNPVGSVTTSPAAPEINVKENTTTYLTGATYNFGNIPINTSSPITFTIENNGTADLTFSELTITGSSGFTVTTQPVSPVSSYSSSNFIITCTPNVLGDFTGYLTIDHNDATGSEDPYIINFTANGIPSSISDIVEKALYPYTTNIVYKDYQNSTITNSGQSVGALAVTIRDGGAILSDVDELPTILNSITFSSVNNIEFIRSAALFDANALVANNPVINYTAKTITFTGLAYTCPDNEARGLTLRVSFNSAVTDNAQMSFSVLNSDVSVSGSYSSSLFSTFLSVTSSITGDKNRIEVTADRIIFETQPVNTNLTVNITPNPIVAFVDINNNKDFDSDRSIDLTTSGSGMTSSTPYSITAPHSGLVTLSGISFSSVQTNINLTATTTDLAINSVNSTNFDITGVNFATGDWRPTINNTDFATNNTAGTTDNWEYFDGTSWGLTPGNAGPQSAATPSRILINKTGITAGGNCSNDYNDIVILNGGELILNDWSDAPSSTFINSTKMLEVQTGGTLKVQGNFLKGTGANLIVRDGGKMIINEPNMDNAEEMWAGDENFEDGSFVEIQDWEWTNSGLLNVDASINYNTNGYKFGNLKINTTTIGANNWTLISGSAGIINLCYNNLVINSTGTGYITGANITGTNGFVVNGNMTVEQGNFAFGSSNTTGTFDHQFTIIRNFEFNSTGTLKAHVNLSATASSLTGSVNFKGNFTIGAGAILTNDYASDIDKSRVCFNINGSGTINSPQYINAASTLTGININILNNTFAKLKSNNLVLNSLTSTTTTLTVAANSSFHFGWDDDDITPLIITLPTSTSGTTRFNSQSVSTLFVTSSLGINNSTGSLGNVQLSASNRIFEEPATFWFVGKENQVTGDAFSNSSKENIFIVEMIDNTKTLTLSEELKFANTTIHYPASGGMLDIRRGLVIETETAYISSCDGTLHMSGGEYRISRNSETNDLIPRMIGSTFPYVLTGGTIELNGNGNQILRGGRDYYSLTFSNAGTKNTSSAITNIGDNSTLNSGIVTIRNNAVLDVQNNEFSGNAAFTMTDNSYYKQSRLNETLPELLGTYTLTGGTVELYGTSSTQTHSLRGTDGFTNNITYNNIEINSTDANVAYDEANVVASANFNVAGTMNVNSPACFKIKSTLSIGGAGKFDLKSGATLKYGSPDGITISGTTGNIRTSERIFPSTASYGFTGTVSPQTTGNGLPSNIENLYLEKEDATDNVILNTIQVNGNMILREGVLRINAGLSTPVLCDNASGFGNVNIESGASLEILPNKAITIEGSITNAAGATGIIIKSDATGTGSLKQDNGAVEATVERFLIGNRWHFLISPLSTVSSDIMLTEGDDTNPNYYNYGETTCDYWDADDNFGAVGWADGSANLSTTGGYVFNRYELPNKTYSLTGGVLDDGTPSKIFNLTYTDCGEGAVNLDDISTDWDSFEGWNFVGNPYTCAINWDNSNITKTNIENGIYFYNGTNYVFYGGATMHNEQGITINGNFAGNNLIPAGQGFFVKVIQPAETGNGTGSLTFPASSRVHETHNLWKSENSIFANLLRFNIEANGYTDETVVRTLDYATDNHDINIDGYKMFNWDKSKPQIFTTDFENSRNYVLNSIPEISVDKQIPVGIYIGETGEYTINFTENTFANIHIYLEDKSTNPGTFVKINSNTSYSFTQNSGTNTERFILHFKKNNSPVANVQDIEILEDSIFEYDLSNVFSDIDEGDELTFEILELPAWISNSNFIISATPTNNEVGIHLVKIRATDLSGSSTIAEFSINVTNVNDAPFVNIPALDQIVIEDEIYTFSLAQNTFIDVDQNDSLSYSFYVLNDCHFPDWLNFNNENLTFTCQPKNADVGIYEVFVKATDKQGLNVSTYFSIEVKNVNDTPLVVVFATDIYTNAGIELTIDLDDYMFLDMDIEYELTYSSLFPSWLIFDNVFLTYNGIPEISGTEKVTVTATDSDGAFISDEFNIFVQPSVSIIDIECNISVYPNPSNGKFLISNYNNHPISIIITDLSGRRIMEFKNISDYKTEIDLSSYAKGIYNLEFITENKVYYEKLILK